MILLYLAIVIALSTLVAIGFMFLSDRARYRAQAQPGNEWHVEEVDSQSHPITSVHLVLGERREYFGSIDRLDDNYEDRLYALQAAAEDEVVERNTIRKHELRKR